MAHYVRVLAEQIPRGGMALLLFVHKDQLCAGVMKHRHDGRLDRIVPADPRPQDLILGICRLMSQLGPDEDLLVVLEPLAYWPEAFPQLRAFDPHAARAAPDGPENPADSQLTTESKSPAL